MKLSPTVERDKEALAGVNKEPVNDEISQQARDSDKGMTR